MPNCMERTERVLLEYSLAVQASNKNTKWLMPRHWQRTIKALTICIEDRSFVRHISSGGSSPPIRTPLLCLIQHFPTVLVPNCCNDQGQEWNYLFLFFHAWHHFVLLCLVSTWTPVFFFAILAIMNNRQMKANGWTFGGEKPAAYMHGPTWKRKIRWRKKAKRLSSSNIVTESFGPEGKRRHERLALLLQA